MAPVQERRSEHASMIKMQIVLDREKIKREGRYRPDSLESAIDALMVDRLGLSKAEDGFYCGSNHKDDFSKFGLTFSFLRRRDWFLDNVEIWLYFNDGGSGDRGDFVIEDFKEYSLEHPAGGGFGMTSRHRKAVHFDLDTRRMEDALGANKRRRCYAEVSRFFEQRGFDHRQWSGYVSCSSLAYAQAYEVFEELIVRCSWILDCVKRFEVTDFVDESDAVWFFENQKVMRDSAIDDMAVARSLSSN